MKSINKSWQDRRIAAINRISKKRNLPSNPDSPYWDEYCKIMDSSYCKNKKEYKEKYKND